MGEPTGPREARPDDKLRETHHSLCKPVVDFASLNPPCEPIFSRAWRAAAT